MPVDGPVATLDLFLEVEFLHSLGCYTNARIQAQKFDYTTIHDSRAALERTKKLNERLDLERDDPAQKWRHPKPCDDGELLLANQDDARERLRRITDFYNTGVVALEHMLNHERPGGEKSDLEQLGECLVWERDPGSSVVGVNGDFQRRQEGDEEPITTARLKRRIETKQARFVERRQAVEAVLSPKLTYRRKWGKERAAERAGVFCDFNLSRTGESKNLEGLTPGFVIECLVAAHLRLHHVEYILSLPFKTAVRMNEVEREDALQLLREAEALNTFVYVASWSLPWLFAANDDEMENVLKGCVSGFDCGFQDRNDGGSGGPDVLSESDPAVFPALWRAQRLAILALHRRAFGHALRDAIVDDTFNDTAFKDFHKLQRLLRVQRRGLPEPREDSGEGGITPESYIAGMDALAETHIGDLYRSDHAYPVALEHFCDAQDRLEELSRELSSKKSKSGETEGRGAVAKELRDSRWRIHLMLSKGKGFYEAGNLKRSVKWLLKSWSALLVLSDFYESKRPREDGEAKPKSTPRKVFRELEEAIESLRRIRNDPDFSKEELSKKIEPIIRRAVKAPIPKELEVIGAEILLRLGHVLYVLRMDTLPEDSPKQVEREDVDQLAFSCLERAGELDEYSTLVSADRLKIEYKRGENPKSRSPHGALSDPEHQWPFGRGNPDQIIRMIEYHLLWWLAVSEIAVKANEEQGLGSPAKQRLDCQVARELIAGLLTHTDSINVRQSQVYRYLMQPKRPARRIGPGEGWEETPRRGHFGAKGEAAIEFVCLRRYSSFFPFVPRPSAFRSLGGGYLLRLHHEDDGCPQPFGIAVDPGPDYIENLYRCGFGLGDINMIVLTHDHPDHMVDLDPILSLLGYRMKQGDPTFKAPHPRDPDAQARRLLIVGNESVVQRLNFFNKPHVSAPGAGDPHLMRPDAVQVVSFDEFDSYREEINRVRETDREPEILIPEELRLRPVVSIRHRDTFGMLAYGFRLSLGDAGPSIGFTGDTGGFLLKYEKTGEVESEESSRWNIRTHDEHDTMKLSGNRTWREHWEDVLDADVMVAHVSGLPLSQLLVLANGGGPHFDSEQKDEQFAALLSEVWDGLEESVRKQVTFAFWLREKDGIASLPLEDIEKGYKWPMGHLYLIGLLEFARAYRSERRRVGRPGLFLVGELREELGSLRGKIAASLNEGIFTGEDEDGSPEVEPGCQSLTADVGLRLMISREKGEARVRVLCSTCDLDNDRTRTERFHDPTEIREVCVKGENEGMFYNCSNHDPSHHRHPVFLERVERYDVFSAVSIH